MREIIRRVVLLAFVLGATTLALRPAPELLIVRVADMASERASALGFTRQATLEEYIAKRTEGRAVAVGGEEWEQFYSAVLATGEGSPPSPQWRARRGHDYQERDSFFYPWERPLADVAGGLSDGRVFTYLSLGEGVDGRYLAVTYARPRDAIHGAPARMLYPGRRYSLWLLAAGLAFYLLFPRRRRADGAVRYARLNAEILPDAIGIILVTLFYAVPWWVIPANATNPSVLAAEGGWIVLTVVLWALALSSVSVLGVAAWYASFELETAADGLRVTTWRGERMVLFSEMVEAGLAASEPPRWLVGAGLVASLFSWRALGPTLLVASPSESDLKITLRQGPPLTISLSYLRGLERVVQALQAAGVPLQEELREAGEA